MALCTTIICVDVLFFVRCVFLTQGASFYGKRKSAFHGEMDTMKKEDATIANAEEVLTKNI